MESHAFLRSLESQSLVSDVDSNLSDSEIQEKSGSVSFVQLVLLTIVFGGLQTVFCVEFSLGSIHLLSLEVPKPVIAIIWLSGPIAGVCVQPYFGVWSDSSHFRWGRRRPFIAFGALGTILSLLGLAWVKAVADSSVWLTVGIDGVHRHTFQKLVTILATVFIWFLNVAIQAVQCGSRALIVDKCPPHQQDRASAFASCMIGLGNIISYTSGSLDLSGVVVFQDSGEIKALSLLASSILAFTVLLTCVSITEDCPSRQLRTDFKAPSFLETLRQIFNAMNMNEIYSTNSKEKVKQATRLSSKALMFFAIVSIITGVLVLLLFHILFQDKYEVKNRIFSASSSKRRLSKKRLIAALWQLSHVIFALCMFASYWISSSTWATLMIALTGMSWAITTWAPFTLIGMEASANQTTGLSIPEGGKNEAGVMIGLLNVSICLPQILAVIGSSTTFWWLGDENDDTSVVCLLSFGGVSALIATYFCSNFKTSRG
ncbi:hypothetical protein B7494_g3024 [Chlorociboria aeruginascens]|nr:hypothetical protein B7494_g3024 [Chlorociboria aeruginascens]